MKKCMPSPPKVIAREFLRQHYTILNKSPEIFFTDSASFAYKRLPKYKHTGTKIDVIDTLETLDNGLFLRIIGEISYNEQPIRHTSFQYFVQNEQTPDEQTTLKPTESCVDSNCDENDPMRNENEVKLDSSDSGLSSDAEKAIMDMQSMSLQNISQGPCSITEKNVMKRGPSPSTSVESESIDHSETKPTADSEISHSAFFRGSCILTIGNVINPKIEFDDETPADVVTSKSDKPVDKSSPESAETYADLPKAASKNEWVNEMAIRRNSNSTADRSKFRSFVSSARRNCRPDRSDRTDRTPLKDIYCYSNRSLPKNDQLQVFIGATEDCIVKMLPLYAFISYDNIQSIRDCLSRKNSFYWPENARDSQKLNGDSSIDVRDDGGNAKSNENHNTTRELKQFARNFVSASKESNNKRALDANIFDAVTIERLKWSTRAPDNHPIQCLYSFLHQSFPYTTKTYI